jgi:hypothetical protein
MQSIAVMTSWPGTTVPSDESLDGKVIERQMGSRDLNISVVASSGSGVYTLVGFVAGSADRWMPIGDIDVDSSVYGGVGFGRFSPGSSYTHFGIYQKTAATLSAQYIGFDRR